MPSTYTVNLGIEKPATGEQSGTWGDTTNTNFDILDQAINGAVRVTLTGTGTSGSPNQIQITDGATSDGRNKWIEIYSASDLGGPSYVELFPNDAEKILFIRNSLGGNQSILLFQGTYDAARDLEVPAGVDMVVKFDGTGASTATVTDVYTKLRVTELTTPTLTATSLTSTSLTATSADINGGTVDNSVIGGTTPAAITGTTITANTSLNIAGDGATVTGIKDEDNMASNSATKLATQQSIKAYVDSQVSTVDTWSEVLANGATSGATSPEVTAGQVLKTDTINETSVGSGVTIDSVLLKDDVVNATDVEVGSISANDGTQAATIANTTGVMTIASSVLTSADINGGSIDGTTIGATTPAAATFTQANFGDNNKAIFGAGSDLQIYHNGTDSIISDEGTGRLILEGSTQIIMRNSTSSGWMLRGVEDGATELYHNNAKKLSTTSGGIDVTGTVTSDGADLDGAVTINEAGASVDFRVESLNNENMLFVDGSANAIGIGTNAPQSLLHIASTGEAKLTIEGDSNNDAGEEAALLSFKSDAGAVGHSIGIEQGTDNDLVIAAGEGASSNVSSGISFKTKTTGTTTPVEYMNLNSTGVLTTFGSAIFNEGGDSFDFRVESANNASMLFVDAGFDRVGIGTLAPGTKLQVDSDGGAVFQVDRSWFRVNQTLSTWTSMPNPNPILGWDFKTGPGDMMYMASGGDTPIGSQMAIVVSDQHGFKVGRSGYDGTDLDVDSSNEFFRIDINGSVGIGTAAPSGLLTVSRNQNALTYVDVSNTSTTAGTDGAITRLITSDNAGTGTTSADIVKRKNGQFGLINNETDSGAIFYHTLGTTEMMRHSSTETSFNEGTADIDFRVESDTNANALFVRASDSRVGINQSNPQQALDVSGTATADVFIAKSSSFNTTTDFEIKGNGVIRAEEALYLAGGASAGTNGIFFGTKNVADSTGGWDADITQRMHIKNDGDIFISSDVGIGVSVPTQALDVSGSIKASGDVNITGRIGATDGGYGTSGQILSSTGAGIDWIDASGYTLPEATSTTRGGIELFSDTDQTVAANAVSTTAGRTYGIQLNASGQAVVNVPWTDTNSGGTVTGSGSIHRVAVWANSSEIGFDNNFTWSGTTLAVDGAVTINGSGNDRDFRVESSNDPNALLVDGQTGIVTKGKVPSFNVYAQNGTTDNVYTNGFHFIGNNSNFTSIIEEHDALNDFNTTNGRFTAPVAGIYMFSATVSPYNANNTPRGYLNFYINGTSGTYVYTNAYYYNENFNGTSATVVISLAANDYVIAAATGTNSQPTTMYTASFCGHLVG